MNMHRVTMKPVGEVVAAIQALDLTSVKTRLMDPQLGEGWTQDYADSVEAAYRIYLAMLAKYQQHAEDILLAKDVDEFWHTHILQTMKYMEDCERVFGRYLHHEPHVGEVTDADRERRAEMAERTRALYAQEFGAARDRVWAGAVRAENAAYSAATIKADGAAYSAAAIGAESAAYSAAAIRAERAAYSAAAIGDEHAAYSAAAIKAETAAYSAAAIDPQNAAYSAATMRTENAAYSAAAVKAERVSSSGAAL